MVTVEVVEAPDITGPTGAWNSADRSGTKPEPSRTKHGTKRSDIQYGICLFALASFILALIGLKKFCSFQLMHFMVDVIQNKASRGRLRSGGECRGVAGVRGTAPEPVWGPRGEKRAMENIGSQCNFDQQRPSSIEGFFPCLAYPWGGLPLGAPRLSYR